MKTRCIVFFTFLAGSLYSLSVNAAIIEDFRFGDGSGTLSGRGS